MICNFQAQIQGLCHPNIDVFLRAISGYKDLKTETFDAVHDICAISGGISKFFDIEGICLYRMRYAIPGAAGRTGHWHVPAPPTGPASWSSTRLDSLYPCVIVFMPIPAPRHVTLREMWFSAALSCYAGPALAWIRTAGLWAVLIIMDLISSNRNTRDLALIHVKYAFRLS
jgi:hypothetical protein